MDMYFVGRVELLNWINSTLQLNITKVEQTASGAVACQLVDAVYNSKIPMSKVDFNAKTEYDMLNNYKVLQNAFSKYNVNKAIDVNKLIKARPLDNMEFMQWFKSWFDSQTGGHGVQDYDPVARRATCKSGDLKGANGTKSQPPVASTARTSRASTGAPPAAAAPKATSAGRAKPAAAAPPQAAAAPSSQESTKKTQELEEKLSQLNVSYEEVNQERDFYYSKLRDIEMMCQDPHIGALPLTKYFERILYAEDEAGGAVALNEALAAYSNGGQKDSEGGGGAEAAAATQPSGGAAPGLGSDSSDDGLGYGGEDE